MTEKPFMDDFKYKNVIALALIIVVGFNLFMRGTQRLLKTTKEERTETQKQRLPKKKVSRVPKILPPIASVMGRRQPANAFPAFTRAEVTRVKKKEQSNQIKERRQKVKDEVLSKEIKETTNEEDSPVEELAQIAPVPSETPIKAQVKGHTLVRAGTLISTPTPPQKTPPESSLRPSPSSSYVQITLQNNKPSGTYSAQPLIELGAAHASTIRYCVRESTDLHCCDPESGQTYTEPFYMASGDGQFCVSALGSSSASSSTIYTWNYTVNSSLLSLNVDMPMKKVFQTQQLNEMMTVHSDQFGDADYNFFQRVTQTDPGDDACEVKNFTTSANDMNTLIGTFVNFGAISSPIQIPLSFENKITYGQNFIVSILERVTPLETQYQCLKNQIVVEDFHTESFMGSQNIPHPMDGTYTLQGGLTFYGHFHMTGGRAPASDGSVLDGGFINTIN